MAALVLAGTGLAMSDTARSRISQAIVEIQDAYTSEKYTSLGIRTVMWVNTIDVIKESPLLGSGAGGYSRMYAQVVETQRHESGECESGAKVENHGCRCYCCRRC